MTSAISFPSGPTLGGTDRVQGALRALYFVVVPALLATLVVTFFIPRAFAGITGPLAFVARVGHGYPVLVGVALFVFFSALSRYWRFHLPGWRYLSALPASLAVGVAAEQLPTRAHAASLCRWLGSTGTRRRLRRTLSADQNAELEARLGDTWRGLEAHDDSAVQGGVRALEGLAAPGIAARRRRDGVGLAVTVALAAGAAALLRANVAEPYGVLSASMLPTLEPGDEVIGDKLAYGTTGTTHVPRRGDVIVFRSKAVALGMADAPPVLVKRVVGLPGDRVRMQAGLPIINGWHVPTCDVGAYLYPLPDGQGGAFQGRLLVEFIDDRAYLTVHAGSKAFREEYEVKPDEVFVLGDNRSNSFDSRSWNDGRGGGVPLRGIDARVRWFLVGTHLDGRADWERSLHSLDATATRLHVEGIDRRPLDEGIAKCLKDAPKQTRPPPPGGEGAPTPAPVEGNGL